MDTSDSSTLAREKLSVLLEVSSLVLVGVFLVTVVANILPPQPFSPRWQIGFDEEVIGAASLALVGAVGMELAQVFSPESDRLRRRRKQMKRVALAASIGFLLLVPLQVYASWRIYSSVTARMEQKSSQSAERINELKRVISVAVNHQELQGNIAKLVGRQAMLTEQQLRLPINELKRRLLQRTEVLSSRLQEEIGAQSQVKPDGLIRSSVRIMLSAFLYAIGFAFISGRFPREEKRGLAFGWGGSPKRKW